MFDATKKYINNINEFANYDVNENISIKNKYSNKNKNGVDRNKKTNKIKIIKDLVVLSDD